MKTNPGNLTPSESEDEENGNQNQNAQQSSAKKRIHKNRSKTFERNKQLLKKIDILTRQRDMYRKRYYRAAKNTKETPRTEETPRSKTKRVMKSKNNIIAKKLVFAEVLHAQIRSNYKNMKSPQEKRDYSSKLFGDKKIFKKYKMTKYIKSVLPDCPTRSLCRTNNSMKKKNQKMLFNKVKEDVQKFLQNDEHSRLAPGKKNTKTFKKNKKQKRYLNDTLYNLNKKFNSQHTYTISYPQFCHYRPFWVIYQKPELRDTCQCKLCTNTDFVVAALYHKKIVNCQNSNELVKQVTCTNVQTDCLLGRCEECKNNVIQYGEFHGDMDVTYNEWSTQEEKYKDKNGQIKKSKHTVKLKQKMSAYKLVSMLDEILVKYKTHQAIIRNQYSSIRYLKVSLRTDEVILHMDFSENYSLKYANEVQSFHFGGSREQITLHTCVLYYKCNQYEDVQIKSFCTLSENLKHDPASIMCHLEPVFDWISKQKSQLKMILFLSDGPATQYRNQTMFFLFGHMIPEYFPTLTYSTWNYFESGHGKGAPDGVGATVKRTADRLVGEGNDICSIDILVSKLEERLRNVSLHLIEANAIENKTKEVGILKSKTVPFKGTLQVHQITQKHEKDKPVILTMKAMSCFRCCRGDVHNDNCNHHILGQLKYRSGDLRSRQSAVVEEISQVTDVEEIVCEPSLPDTQEETFKIKQGDPLLVKFESEHGEYYRYVCLVLSVENENDIKVQGLKQKNAEKKEFVVKDNDVFHISKKDILQVLPPPGILWRNRAINK